jgi:indole-3-pyruvate monooxygenase
VDPNTMESGLKDAKRLGFYIPHIDPAVCVPFIPIERPPVVIVGAGPAGLAVAACLSRRQIRTILLEGQAAPDSFGSWAHHFSGLEVTSQKKWCNLPGFAMSDQEFPGEHVTATDYQRYLQLYAARYGVAIRRGVQVESVEKGRNAESTPWRVLCQIENERTEIEASAVVVATGKHRLPQRNTSDDLASRLTASQIPFYHSTDLRDEATWRQAIQSAQDGRLCMVGMGNSAADLATAILKHCPNDGQAKIHVATRTVPPIFPRQRKFLRVDTLGYLVRWMPHALQEGVIRLLWWGIPSSRQCNAAFPGHLPRWNKIRGRVPVIDKYGAVAAALQSGRMVGHGPIVDISSSDRRLSFQDEPHARDTTPRVPVDLVILATGYQQDCLITREDRLNGLYKCGFGNDRLLPLRSIGEEAQRIATEITSDWNVSD